MIRVAVTGASGFLGGYLVEAMLERGWEVVAVVRDTTRAETLIRSGVRVCQADLRERQALASAFAGVDVVIANAALVVPKAGEDFFETNVAGTENVCRAAAAMGVRRLLLVSSVSVYSGRGPDLSEDTPRVEPTTVARRKKPYDVSKALAEAVAEQIVEELNLRLTIVRPGFVIGVGDRFQPLFRKLVCGRIAWIPYWVRVPLVSAGDVAEAIVRCLERPSTEGATYNLVGPDASWADVARAWEQAGGPIARFRLPLPIRLRHGFNCSRAHTDLDWQPLGLIGALQAPLAGERGSETP